jgi:hypothetical protein
LFLATELKSSPFLQKCHMQICEDAILHVTMLSMEHEV